MSKFLFAILILYLLPLVISTIGFYLFDFKGHTVGDFCKYLITEMDDFTPLPYILCPVSKQYIVWYFSNSYCMLSNNRISNKGFE